MSIKDIDKEYVAATYARFPVCLTEGKGSRVYDDEGKEYIDLGTGIAVNTFGYSDDTWAWGKYPEQEANFNMYGIRL